jgi:disulfide bond formation protein DsbB
MNMAFSFRQLFALGALLCLSLLSSAYLLEHVKELHPCPLCLLQRLVFWTLTLIFLIGAIWPHNRKLRLWLSSSVLFFSALGILLAGRQVWLQSLPPDQIPPCTAGFERLLAFHSIPETLQIVISSSGECGVVDYRIFGFSLALWSLAIFILLILYGGILLFLDKKRRK